MRSKKHFYKYFSKITGKIIDKFEVEINDASITVLYMIQYHFVNMKKKKYNTVGCYVTTSQYWNPKKYMKFFNASIFVPHV